MERKPLFYKTYKFRVKTTDLSENKLARNAGCKRFVYNLCLDKRIKTYKKNKKSVSKNDLMKLLPGLKEKHPWLKEADSTSLQQAITDLDKAYQNFFRRVQQGETPGFPKFKKKNSHQSVRVTMSLKLERKLGKVKIGKLGWFGVFGDITRIPESAKIVNMTVSKDTDSHWYVAILCEQKKPKALPKTGKSIGGDLGLNSLLTLSNGKTIDAQQFLRKSEKKLAKEQRKLSKMEVGSNNWKKQKAKVAKIHCHIKNRRKDFNHKLSKRLVTEYDIIALENLCIFGLVKTKLAKSILDAAWSQLISFTQYKADWYGKTVVKVDRFFPSTKTCNVCGLRKKKMKLHVREWECSRCETVHNRDLNAAKNIRYWAKHLVKTGHCMTKQEYSASRRTAWQ